jgi:hypothetical protein
MRPQDAELWLLAYGIGEHVQQDLPARRSPRVSWRSSARGIDRV